MPSHSCRVVVACAGAGKTTRLVRDALERPDARIAIITYTNNNLCEIRKKFGEMNSGIPKHVDLMTWFSFLLRECVRPYQRAKRQSGLRVESIFFTNTKSTMYVKETDIEKFYFANDNLIYSDKVAQFVVQSEMASVNGITRRLHEMYTDVFIDECQDLAGWDLDVLMALIRGNIPLTLVGDPRQHIYSTNPSSKNKAYVGHRITDLFELWKKRKLCTVEFMNTSYRCAPAICLFSNSLWPDLPPMESARSVGTGHEGVFMVREEAVAEYIRRYQPQVLRYDRNAKDYGQSALNFGQSKGLEFDHVLIVPTGPIKKFLTTGKLSEIDKSRDKLHVAVTRARHSVGFVFDGDPGVAATSWEL